jgi:hypothetical protein
MKLLVDTDAFCKLGVAGLLEDTALIFGARLQECGRLAALPYMLRKGSLRRHFGVEACDGLIALAEGLPVVPEPSSAWLDRFTAVEAIDPGEAQLLAVAAELGCTVVSGDKRALRALTSIDGLPNALAGRVSVLEAILLVLCDRLGVEHVRERVVALMPLDKTVAVCFSPGSADPRDGLRSYYKSLAAEVGPLVLWNPALEMRA